MVNDNNSLQNFKFDFKNINNVIDRFYNTISKYEEGGPDTRYKSWEWCHQAFLENKDTYHWSTNLIQKQTIVDHLALHLAFYLASWGMYRASSYLLQRDYKAHKNAVRIILEEKYGLLWNFDPISADDINKAKELLFNKDNGAYWRIKNSYKQYDGTGDDATDTLVTKILIGSFACIPAFDRFLKSGISYLKKNGSDLKVTQNIEDYSGKTFVGIANFANKHRDELLINSSFYYPIMKCLDMYLWEIGYELDIAKILNEGEINDKKKNKLLDKAKELGML